MPAEYERLYLRLQDEGKVSVEERNGKDDQYLEVYVPKASFHESEFTDEEIHIFEAVASHFRTKSTGEIIRLSHEEDAWKENETDRQLISYQRYAFGVGASLPLSD